MVKVQEAEQQIVTHYKVYDQRPSDSELLMPALDVHERQFGHVPRLVTADAGFFSARNEAAAYARGVKRVAIPNLATKSADRKALQKKRWFRSALKWRTGCEGHISLLKRRHGLLSGRKYRRQMELGKMNGRALGLAEPRATLRRCEHQASRLLATVAWRCRCV